MRLALLSLALAAAVPALPAAAQDLSVYAGAGLTIDNADDDTNTDLNLYVEGETHHVYFGLSGDAINAADSSYIDLYAGYRNATESGISYDLSYDQTFYPSDSSSNYGTLALSVGVPVGDMLTVTFDADYYNQVGENTGDAYLTADYYLNDKITLTASMGLVQNAGGSASTDNELAIAYQIGDETSVTLHYYDGNNYEGYFALDLNWDTTLLGG